ncbi:MAG: 2-phosphosulfolactate phosphatase [bacterium]
MKIDVYFTPNEFSDERLNEYLAVVVDVLRSSTSICAALKAGAKEIIPTDSIAGATQLALSISRDAILLCGEREGKLVDGFDLGNSPLQFTPEIVKGKALIFTTTNGTPTIVKARHAHRVLIGGFVNLSTIVNALEQSNHPVCILCAGKLDQFAIEDAVCAGRILSELQVRLRGDLELNDAASAALVLSQQYRNSITKVVSESHHGKYLKQIDMEVDLPFCADTDRLPVLPIFRDGKITLA